MMNKVTYNIVAIPASLDLVRNTRASRHIHPLAYRQIQNLKDYYRFTFFPRTIIHWNAPPPLPTYRPFPPWHSLEVLSPGDQCFPLNTNPWFYLLSKLYITLLLSLYKLISPPFLSLFFNYPIQHLVFRNTRLMSPTELRRNGRKKERKKERKVIDTLYFIKYYFKILPQILCP